MDLKEFSYLITLAENGSVSKAADQLFMAQSSLSQFLHQYESELGVKLFVRTSKGIRPTRNGAVFIGHLKKLMTDYQRAKNELWDCENLKGGRVTLGISSFRGRRILPIILKRFYEKYPDVQVDVVEENIMKLEDLLLDGQLDLAVVAMPSAKLKREITFLKKDEIFIVTNRNHSVMEIAHRREHTPSWWIDLKDAAKFKFILSDHTTMLGTISRIYSTRKSYNMRSSTATLRQTCGLYGSGGIGPGLYLLFLHGAKQGRCVFKYWGERYLFGSRAGLARQ